MRLTFGADVCCRCPKFQDYFIACVSQYCDSALLNRAKNCGRFCCSCPGGDLEGWENTNHSNQASSYGCSQPSMGTCEHRLSTCREQSRTKCWFLFLKIFLVAFKMICWMLWHFHFGAFGSPLHVQVLRWSRHSCSALPALLLLRKIRYSFSKREKLVQVL